MRVAGSGAARLTCSVAVLVTPLTVVAVTWTSPGCVAVTKPLPLMVAIDVGATDQVIGASTTAVLSASNAVAVKSCDPPELILAACGVSATPVISPVAGDDAPSSLQAPN